MEIQNPKRPASATRTGSSREPARRRVESLDRVDVTERARLFADDSRVDGEIENDESRARRIEELREELQNGTLHTRERAEDAARRMLGG